MNSMASTKWPGALYTYDINSSHNDDIADNGANDNAVWLNYLSWPTAKSAKHLFFFFKTTTPSQSKNYWKLSQDVHTLSN